MIYLLLSVLLIISFFLDSQIAAFAQTIQNPAIMYCAQWISQLGSVAAVLIIMTTLFLWEERKKEWIPALWGSVIVTFIITHAIKFIVQRPRPLGILMNIPILNWVDFSFPSGHAAVAFATVPILDKEFPKLKWFWILFAGLVAISRIYLNVHYASDVVSGIMIGYGFGLLFVYLEKKYKIFDWMKVWKR